MKLNATEGDLRTAAEALKLAAILDDRAPAADKARIAAWAEQLQRNRLQRSDVLDGLQAFYDNPSERAIQIGDLIHHARIVKRRRLDHEADEAEERRREVADAKASDEIHLLTAEALMGPTVKKTPWLVKAENGLQTCHGKAASQAAIAEYLAARRQATGRPA